MQESAESGAMPGGKRVGIVTMHKIHNYGSALQAAATLHVFRRRGYSAELIDYAYPNRMHRQSSVRGRVLHAGNYALKSLLPGNPAKRFVENYERFSNDYLGAGPRFYAEAVDIYRDPPSYDLLVAGSDQIWNPLYTNGDGVFLLDFASDESKMVSYASSFGRLSLAREECAHFGKLLKRFDLISVREPSGAEIVRNCADREAEVCLDPTLLLDKSQWMKMSRPIDEQEGYILCYGSVGKRGFVEELAQRIQARTGLRIVRMNGKSYDYFNRAMRFVLDAGPSEFLSYLSGASFVISESFHATAFSVNFGVPFVTVVNDDADNRSRAVEFLSHLGMGARVLKEGDFGFDSLLDPIDWSDPLERLAARRVVSLRYLSSVEALVPPEGNLRLR